MIMNYLQLTNAKQFRMTQVCKNTKEKLHETYAAIWFNKLCRKAQLILSPSYIIKQH